MKDTVRQFWRKKWELMPWSQAVVILSLLIGTAYFTLLMSQAPYTRDDLVRTLGYGRGWWMYGRFLGDLLSRSVTMSSNLFNVAPFSQMIAIGFLVAACLNLALVWQKKVTRLGLLIVSMIALSPMIIDCLLYNFDCLFMMIGVWIATLPVLVMEIWPQKRKWGLIAIGVATLGCLMTYQPTVNCLVVLLIIRAMRQVLTPGIGAQNRLKLSRIAFELGQNLCGVVIGGLIFYLSFKLTLSLVSVHPGSYSLTMSKPLGVSWESIKVVYQRELKLGTSLWIMWGRNYIGQLALVMVGGWLVFILGRTIKNRRWAEGLFLIGLWLMLWWAVAATQMVLQEEMIKGRALSAIGVAVAGLTMILYQHLIEYWRWRRLVWGVFLGLWVVNAISYHTMAAKIVRAENDWENQQIQELIGVWNTHVFLKNKQFAPTVVEGRLTSTPFYTKEMEAQYPALRQLLAPIYSSVTAMSSRWQTLSYLPVNFISLNNEDLSSRVKDEVSQIMGGGLRACQEAIDCQFLTSGSFYELWEMSIEKRTWYFLRLKEMKLEK